MRKRHALVIGLGLLGACSGTPGSMDPAPPAHGYQLKTPDVTLAAGEERYECYTVSLAEAADVAVTQFQSFTGPVVHHYEVFQTLAPEQSGLFDCSQTLIKQTWLPLFGGGVASGGLTLPDGAGFKIPKDAQLLVQLHLLNATPSSATTHIVVNMDYAADATTVTPAGIFALGSMTINLPAGAMGMQVGSMCKAPKQLNVFAVQPHMHKLGTKIVLEHGTAASPPVVYQRDPWVFGAQPIDLFSTVVQPGDYIGTECTFDNTTGQTVTYGESTTNEMCYFVLFYTPFDKLDGCID
jgi:Copper type II ascorbate-dependent monooxygenase, C-terminal domain